MEKENLDKQSEMILEMQEHENICSEVEKEGCSFPNNTVLEDKAEMDQVPETKSCKI